MDIFIGRDFNVDIKRQNTPHYTKLSRFLKINQLKQYIKQITRPEPDTIIDLLISISEVIIESGVIDVNISDHLPIFFIRKKIKVKYEKVAFTG